MATKEQVKKTILDIAGNPDSGVIYQLADEWASAIVGLDSATPVTPDAKDGNEDSPAQDGVLSESPVKEVRVVKPSETR